jgi:hypothetical protein
MVKNHESVIEAPVFTSQDVHAGTPDAAIPTGVGPEFMLDGPYL